MQKIDSWFSGIKVLWLKEKRQNYAVNIQKLLWNMYIYIYIYIVFLSF